MQGGAALGRERGRFVSRVAGRRGTSFPVLLALILDTTMLAWAHLCTGSLVILMSNSSAVFDCRCRSLIEGGGVVCRAVGLFSAFGHGIFTCLFVQCIANPGPRV